MDVLELSINRHSASRLTESTPTDKQSQNILRAGMRTPDRESMQPWYLFVIEGEGCERSSAILEQEVTTAGSDNKTTNKARNASFRVSLIMTVVVKYGEDHKTPRWKQEVSAGCAVMVMQMAAVAQELGDIWRSGALTEDPVVRETFGCHEQDKIVGLLYPDMPQPKTSTSINVPDPMPLVIYF